MKQTVVVCGVTGFIGRNIAEALAENDRYEVIGVHHTRPAFDHSGIRFVCANLTDPIQVGAVLKGADIVIQAAATTSGSKDIVNRPYIHVADNAVMNSHILRASFDHGVKHVVFFSCTVMYQSSDKPLLEGDFDASVDPDPKYFGAAWTKVYIEKMCEFYSRLGKTKFTVIRHSNVYGPHDKYDLDRSHVFGATVAKVMTAQDGKIVVWGDGTERRDVLYVSDLVDFVRIALERQQAVFGLYNAGSGEAVSVRDLASTIIAASGRTLNIEFDRDKPTIQTFLCLDCSLAEAELGWAPKVGLKEGVVRTLKWYREWILSKDE